MSLKIQCRVQVSAGSADSSRTNYFFKGQDYVNELNRRNHGNDQSGNRVGRRSVLVQQGRRRWQLKPWSRFGSRGRHGRRHFILSAARRPDAIRPGQPGLRRHGHSRHCDASCDYDSRCSDGRRRDQFDGNEHLRRLDEFRRCDEFRRRAEFIGQVRFIRHVIEFIVIGFADISA